MAIIKQAFLPALAAAVFVSAAGCGRKVSYAEVTGTVTLGGKVLAGVEVTFYPVTEGTEGLPVATGKTDESGRYTLVLKDGKPGAVAGQNRVVVNWPLRERSDDRDKQPKQAASQPFIPVRYTVATETPLIFEVKSGGTQVIDLTLDPNLPSP